MPYGLRMRSSALSMATTFDYFFPNDGMPDFPHTPKSQLFETIHTTPSGNAYMYSRGKIKVWDLNFLDVPTYTALALQHICEGWAGSQQIVVVFYGTAVTGTTDTPGNYDASQIWEQGMPE